MQDVRQSSWFLGLGREHPALGITMRWTVKKKHNEKYKRTTIIIIVFHLFRVRYCKLKFAYQLKCNIWRGTISILFYVQNIVWIQPPIHSRQFYERLWWIYIFLMEIEIRETWMISGEPADWKMAINRNLIWSKRCCVGSLTKLEMENITSLELKQVFQFKWRIFFY